MRIGILTVPFNNNYGGFLQAFALKHTFISTGNEVIFLIRKRDRTPLSWKRKLKNTIKCLLGYDIDPYRDKWMAKMGEKTIPFQQKYLYPQTKPIYNNTSAKHFLKYNVDIFVVGSDQVWRYAYAQESTSNYFFDFLSDINKPRFAYAASFGTSVNEYPKDLQLRCLQWLNNFKGISVREKEAINIINSFGINDLHVQHVLDPTLLCNPNVYLNLIENANLPKTNKSFVLRYVLDDNEVKERVTNDITSFFNCEVKRYSCVNPNTTTPIPAVEQWLQDISECKFVVTDSYHGMLFSIIFHKPFAVFINNERGAERFLSFLLPLNLENRIINNKSDIIQILQTNILWDEIDKIIADYRTASMNFIHKMLTL